MLRRSQPDVTRIPDHLWLVACDVQQRSSTAGELVYGILLQLGINPQDIVEKIQHGRSRFELFLADQLRARQLVKTISSAGLSGIKISIKKIKKSDWQDRWKKGIKPFALTKTIDIIPRWVKKSHPKSKRFSILIDTNLAFGTGLHETTRFMAQLIEAHRGEFISFLDVGTGSGILVMVAHYCGAKNLTAIDIETQSVKVAKENLEANRVLGVKVLKKDLAKWNHHKTYDFVAANLVTHDLMAFGEKLVEKVNPGKFLAVSGISLANLPKLRKSFSNLPLKELSILKGKEWSAILYQRI